VNIGPHGIVSEGKETRFFHSPAMVRLAVDHHDHRAEILDRRVVVPLLAEDFGHVGEVRHLLDGQLLEKAFATGADRVDLRQHSDMDRRVLRVGADLVDDLIRGADLDVDVLPGPLLETRGKILLGAVEPDAARRGHDELLLGMARRREQRR
jgi:hypothetical protein